MTKTSFKVVLVGSSSVGKSSMVERLTEGIFPDEVHSTVGVEFKAFAVPVDDQTVRLQIWDTAGQERFKSVSKAYFRNAVGAVLMFDITQESTFEDLSTWLADLQQLAHPNAFVLLVGNKSDLEDQRRIGVQEAKHFANQHRLEYIETSALSGRGIKETFTRLAFGIAARAEDGQVDVISSTGNLAMDFPPEEETKLGCGCSTSDIQKAVDASQKLGVGI
jgi:small GTP-binding protein